jgi:hypothetical protein
MSGALNSAYPSLSNPLQAGLEMPVIALFSEQLKNQENQEHNEQ